MKPLLALSLLALAGCKPAEAPAPTGPALLSIWMGEDGACAFSLDGRRLEGSELKRKLAALKGSKIAVRAGNSDTPYVCVGNAISMLKGAGITAHLAAPPSGLAAPATPDR